MPRFLKMSTAVGESWSEIRTLGAISGAPLMTVRGDARGSGPVAREKEKGKDAGRRAVPATDPRVAGARYAALASSAFSAANAQSSQAVSASRSEASTVAPAQIRRPAGASR